MHPSRHSTGIPALDQLLGGGLLPGTLTVVLGATGIGKTQLGLQFAHAGVNQQGEPGCVADLTTRGDSQNHAAYAQRMLQWQLRDADQSTAGAEDSPASNPLLQGAEVFENLAGRAQYLNLLEMTGRRVTRDSTSTEEWQDWKAEWNHRLERAIAFFYRNFIAGTRRCVVDGIEPAAKSVDSQQFEMFSYLYHQILRKDHDWLARDLFRIRYRELEPLVMRHAYESSQISCLLLATSHEVMLEDLIRRPIATGDELSNANTIILMGKVHEGTRMSRALYVAKHRGSACDESIVPYTITESGLELRV